jgi:hypothetical protein
LNRGLIKDEIFVQKTLKLLIFKKLLTQQFAAPSGIRSEVKKNLFILGFGLGQGFVQRALEPALGRGH